jgi:4-oxalocrotonate tautomerase
MVRVLTVIGVSARIAGEATGGSDRTVRSELIRRIPASRGELDMPLVQVKLVEGVFSDSQKQEMIRKVTDAMVSVEGETMRGVTWVVVEEVKSGCWGIGGKALTTGDITAMAGRS